MRSEITTIDGERERGWMDPRLYACDDALTVWTGGGESDMLNFLRGYFWWATRGCGISYFSFGGETFIPAIEMALSNILN